MVRPANLRQVELPSVRGKAAGIAENILFIRFITVLIVLNAVTLGLETDADILATYGAALHAFDMFVLAVFIVELSLKLFAYRLNFFRVGWNVFDFLIVAVSLIPSGAGFAILRALRVFRLFRLITLVPQMRSVIGALFHAIPGMASIIGILLVILYVSAVLGTQIFGQHADPDLQGYFGSVMKSMYTMFQLMTLDDWTDVANTTMQHYPWAWAFFVPFILVTTFAVLNLFIGIIVDALNIVKEQDLQDEEETLLREIRDLKDTVRELKDEVAALRTAGGTKS